MYPRSKLDLNPPPGWHFWFAWRIYTKGCKTPLETKRALAYARAISPLSVVHGWCEDNCCYVVQFKDPEYC
jgi:hypothetical protein